MGKGRGRGEIHRAPSVLKCERCCSPLDCRLSEWGRDLALRVELGRLRVMTKCQVSPGPPGEAGPRRGPRAAGVRSEESLPARVLCAAWRGCGQPPARASPGPTGGPPRRGAPPGRPGRSRRAPGQVLTWVPGHREEARLGALPGRVGGGSWPAGLTAGAPRRERASDRATEWTMGVNGSEATKSASKDPETRKIDPSQNHIPTGISAPRPRTVRGKWGSLRKVLLTRACGVF